MKIVSRIIFILALTIAVTSIAPVRCKAAEKEEESFWSDENASKQGHKRWELTEEKIERVMNQLKETDPEKAKELEKLQQENPEEFEAEIKKVIHEKFAGEYGKHTRGKTGRDPQPGPNMPFDGPDKCPKAHMLGKGMMEGAMPMHPEYAEYLEWLKENYPEKAEKLSQLRGKRPELYGRQMALGLNKHRKIFEAAKDNPELAKVLKEDLGLKEKRDKLLEQISAETDTQKKEKLVEQLQEVVSSRFDLIVKRKQIRYEALNKKLEKLQEQVKQSEAEVDKYKNPKLKEESVKARVEELLSKSEKFDWD